MAFGFLRETAPARSAIYGESVSLVNGAARVRAQRRRSGPRSMSSLSTKAGGGLERWSVGDETRDPLTPERDPTINHTEREREKAAEGRGSDGWERLRRPGDQTVALVANAAADETQ